jgi:hypothetical protein
MTVFRSEAHVDIWLDATKRDKGAVVPLSTVWRLARAWYADPRDPNWRPRTREENQAVLTSVGLTGDFWQFG